MSLLLLFCGIDSLELSNTPHHTVQWPPEEGTLKPRGGAVRNSTVVALVYPYYSIDDCLGFLLGKEGTFSVGRLLWLILYLLDWLVVDCFSFVYLGLFLFCCCCFLFLFCLFVCLFYHGTIYVRYLSISLSLSLSLGVVHDLSRSSVAAV
eukprot:gene7893-5518_t